MPGMLAEGFLFVSQICERICGVHAEPGGSPLRSGTGVVVCLQSGAVLTLRVVAQPYSVVIDDVHFLGYPSLLPRHVASEVAV